RVVTHQRRALLSRDRQGAVGRASSLRSAAVWEDRRRDESRRGTHECVRHELQHDVECWVFGMRPSLCFLLAAFGLWAQAPSDAEIGAILAERIDKLHQNVGIAVGIIDARGRRYISHGTFGVSDPRPVGSDTIFEVGSTTK